MQWEEEEEEVADFGETKQSSSKREFNPNFRTPKSQAT
jgi:hypothetical protein